MRKNGTYFPVGFSSLPVIENEKITGAVVTFRDITERKQAEEARQKSEDQFHSLYMNMIDGATLSELTYNDQGVPDDYILIETNPAFETQLGISGSSVVGKTGKEIYGLSEAPFLEIYSQVDQTGEPIVFETYFQPLAKYYSILIYCPYKGRLATIFKDITENRLAEEELVQNKELLESSEERFRLLYENAKVGLYRTTTGGTIVLANRALVTMLGYQSFDELAQKNVEQDGFETPHQRKAFLEKIEQTGEVENFESTWIRQDRTPIFVKESARAIRDTNGKTLYYDGTVEDITERKKIENALRESEKKLKTIFDIMPVGITVLDEDRNIVEANPAIEKILDISKDELLKGSYRLRSYLRADHTPMPVEEYASVRATKELRMVSNVETGVVKEDSNVIWTDVTAVPVSFLNWQVVLVTSDITELKQAEEALRDSEERYRLLFETSADGILIVDVETKKFKYANPALCQMLGYTGEELTSLGIADIHPDQDLQRVIAEFESQARGDKVLAPNIPCLRKDGNIVYADVNTTAITIDGRPCAVGLFRDITERKRAEEAVKSALERRHRQQTVIATVAVSSQLVVGDVREFAHQLNEHAAKAVDAERVSMWLFNDEGNELRCVDLYELSPDRHSAGAVLKQNEYMNEFEALRTSKYIDANDPLTDTRTAGYVEGYLKPLRITSMLDAVIREGNRNIGVLCFEHVGQKHNWEPDEISFICQLADQIAIAVLNRERLLAEELLRQSEIKLQVILESTADGILAINGNGKVIKTNTRFAELWKIPPAVLNSGDDGTLLNFVLEQLVNPKLFLDKVQQLNNSTAEDSDTLFFKDGRIFERYSAPLILDDKIIGRVWSFRDITERKRAEEALRESKNIIQNIIDNSPSLIYILDLDGKFSLANKKLAEVLNLSAEKLIGNTRHLFMPKEFAEQHRNNDLQIITTEQAAIYEEEIRESDKPHIYLTQKFPLFDSEGKIYAVGGISTDITERKQAEEALYHERTLLRTIIDLIPDAIYAKDIEGRKTLSNLKEVQLTGKISEAELIGKTDFELYPESTAKRSLDEDKLIIQSGNPILDIESSLIDKDGQVHWQLGSKVPLRDMHGHITGIVGFSHDTTKSKQAETVLRDSERRYRLLIETVNEGILVAQNGLLKFVNPMMQVITGFTQEELLTLPFISYVHPEDREIVIGNHMKRLKGEQFLPRYQFRIVKKDGSIRRIEMNGIMIEWEGQPATLNMLTDITERKQAEEALQHERTLLRTVIDNVPDLIYSKDQLCRKTLANLADIQHTGARTEAEVIGKDDFAFHPKEIAEKFFADDQSVIQTGEPLLNKEEYAIDEEGQEKWLVTSKFPLRNERDQIIGLVGITHDVTKRKQVEEIVERSEVKFRTLFESANDAIFLMKEDTFVDCNFKTEQMFQCRREEILNRHPYEFSPPFQPDGRDSKEKVLEKISAALSGTPQSFEWKYLKLDGTPFDAEVSLNRIYIDGKVLIQAIIRDITKRRKAEEALRESEERFRHLFELSPEAIILIDPSDTKVDWPIVDCNETACKMNGYTREELVGKTVDIFNTTAGTPEERAAYLDKLRNVPVLHMEVFHRHRDGHIFPIDVSTSLVTFLGREMVLAIDRDITERKLAEEEILIKNQQLLKLNAEKDKFFSIISHDLRGPFSGFLGLTELMVEDLPSLTMEQIQEFLVNMRNSATNLYRLLENLLQWSRMQQGSIPFDPEVIHLRSIVDECIAITMEPAKNKGIDLTSDIPENLKVVADNNMLQTVVRNLVSNAQKFTRKGGKIRVSAKATGDKSVEISIKDTGIGMSQAMIGNLFRLDVKTNREGTEGEPSSGLGLLLCKEFVEKHGGQIWAESEEGKGTTFYFTLPIND